MHSLVYFYNWSFAHVETAYSLKWDGDMVLTEDAEGLIHDLSWQLPGKDVIVRVPRHSLYVDNDRVAYLDLGLPNVEPGPDLVHELADLLDRHAGPAKTQHHVEQTQGVAVEDPAASPVPADITEQSGPVVVPERVDRQTRDAGHVADQQVPGFA